MDKLPHLPQARSQVDRWVTGFVGLLFVGLAAAIILSSGSDTVWAYLAAVVVGGLGLDALLSAARNRRSVLSRIGPLP
jgi:hypothetical protein